MNAGMATRMQNAFAVPHRQFQLQTLFRMEDQGAEGFRYRFEPELRWGVAPRTFITVGTSWVFDSTEAEDDRNLSVQALYNFNRETEWLPAAALMVGTAFPTGPEAAGLGALVMGILTKTVGRAEINLNAQIARAAFRNADEPEYRYRTGIGLDHPLDFGPSSGEWGLRTLLRTALFLEQEEERGGNPIWTLETGLFHNFTPASALALGAEFRLSAGRPDVQIVLGYQHTFSAW
jgi:hypothetical protein